MNTLNNTFFHSMIEKGIKTYELASMQPLKALNMTFTVVFRNCHQTGYFKCVEWEIIKGSED